MIFFFGIFLDVTAKLGLLTSTDTVMGNKLLLDKLSVLSNYHFGGKTKR